MQSGYSSGPPAPYSGPAAAHHQHGGPAGMQGPGAPMASGPYYQTPGGPPPPTASHPGQFAPGPPFPPTPSSAGLHRPWSVTGPLPTAPPASQFQTSTYNPSIYGPMPGAQQSPVSPLKPTYQPSGASPGLPAASGADSPGGHPPTTGYPQSHHPQSRPPMQHGGPQPPIYGGLPDQHSYFGKPPLPDRPHPVGINTMFHATDQHPGPTSSPAIPRPYSMLPQPQAMQGPPFPPGPGSSAHYPPQAFTSSYPQQAYSATAGPAPQYHNGPPMSEQRLHGQSYDMPPRPPPLPPGYQVELIRNQQAALQHPPYSNLPPTHRYDPTYQQMSQAQQHYHQAPPPGQMASHGPSSSAHGLGNIPAPPPPPPVPPKTPPGSYTPGEAHRPSMSHGPPPPSTTTHHHHHHHPGSWSSGAPLPGHLGYAPAGPPQLSPPTHTASMTNPSWVPTPEPSIAGTPPPPSPHSSGGPSKPSAVAASQASSTAPHQPAAMAAMDHHRRSSGQHPLGFQGAPPYKAPRMDHQPLGSKPLPPRASSLAQVPWARPPPPNQEPRPEPARTHYGGHPNAQEPPAARPGSADTHGYPQRPSSAAAQPPHQQIAVSKSYGQGNVPSTAGRVEPSSQPPSFDAQAAQGHLQHRLNDPPRQGDLNASSNRPPSSPPVSTGYPSDSQTFSGIGASVLGGIGGPSDWEHFGEPTDEDSDEEENVAPSGTTAPQPAGVLAELDTGSPVRVSQPPPPPLETPPAHEAGLWRQSTTPAPLNPHRRVSDSSLPAEEPDPKPDVGPQDAKPPFPQLSRISTTQTDGGFSSTGATPSEDPSGIIDQAIQAWAPPPSEDTNRKLEETDVPQEAQTVAPIENRDTPGEAPVTARQEGPGMISEQQPLDAGQQIPTIEHRRPSSGLSFRREGTATPDTPSAEGPQEQTQHDEGLPGWFADLDERSKESLSRYAAMLRKEALATSPTEKLRSFRSFVMEESARRGFASEDVMGPEPSRTSNLTGPEPSAAGTGLPTVSGNDEASKSLSTPKRVLTPIQLSSHLAVQDAEEEQQYSPGGRPVLRPIHFQSNGEGRRAWQEHAAEKTATSLNADVPPISLPGGIEPPRPVSPAGNAPIPVDVGDAGFIPPPDYRPQSVVSHRTSKYGFGPTQQASPGDRRSRADTLSSYRSYTPPAKLVSQHLNQAPAGADPSLAARNDRQSVSVHPPVLPPQAGLRLATPSNAKSATPLPPPGLTKKAPEVSKENDADVAHTAERAPVTSISTNTTPSGEPPALIQGLSKLLPTNREHQPPPNDSLATIEQAIQAVTDDPTFPDRLFAAWEGDAKKTREQIQLDRHRRQEEHNAFAERLFSESNINYADLTAMEEDFQRSEATKEAQEIELEYHSYAQQVFDPVYTRLQEQIKDLMEQYIPLIDLMKSTAARQNSHAERSELGRIIDVLQDLHARIEHRHDQVLQAILERDRRYQRAMLQPFYAAGDAIKVREFETHFHEAAQKTRLDSVVTKRQRADRLVQAIEPNVTKGATECLQAIKALADEIHRISETLSMIGEAPLSDRAGIRYELKFAHEWLHVLAGTSEALMRQSHTAALGLRHARSEESVMSATMSGVSEAAFKQLRDEQVKEEERLVQELEQRVRPIHADLQQVLDQIDRTLARVGHVSAD